MKLLVFCRRLCFYRFFREIQRCSLLSVPCCCNESQNPLMLLYIPCTLAADTSCSQWDATQTFQRRGPLPEQISLRVRKKYDAKMQPRSFKNIWPMCFICQRNETFSVVKCTCQDRVKLVKWI